MNVLEGIVTIICPGRTVVVADQLYVVDLRTWRILILAFGAILTCAGIGVLSAQAWARVVAIVFVSLHAVVRPALTDGGAVRPLRCGVGWVRAVQQRYVRACRAP
ncbi:MAG TPA: hypothetical protein VHV74_00880 [Pseudonocardiaceae bacterium]|nr:hypothetical protein [Pseudonocardiaceae bacterium]